jgi:hypothetical protein
MTRLLMCLAAAATVLACPAHSPAGGDEKCRQMAAEFFVLEAIQDGLRDDAVPPALAAALVAKQGDFVPKCRLCELARQALTEYSKETAPKAPAAVRGLPQDMTRRLKSADDAVRRDALRDLITRYMDRAYLAKTITPEYRAELEKRIQAMAFVPKNPAEGLPGGLKFCPSCDGACRVRPKTVQ